VLIENRMERYAAGRLAWANKGDFGDIMERLELEHDLREDGELK